MRNPFMPYIEDFEKEAASFLTKYGFSELLVTPAPVPIEDIIRKMSLQVIHTEKLSDDNSVQGVIAFSKGIIDVYDDEVESYIGFKTDAPSVLIDREIISDNAKRMILVHESFHWYKHRLYFVYKANHEAGTEFAFRCVENKTRVKDDCLWSDEERMEWQAKKITPMILLPKTSLKNKLIELEDNIPGDNLNHLQRMSYVLTNLSEFYHVPVFVVLERLANLGYDFSGYKSSEGNIFEKNVVKKTQHAAFYDITAQESFELYLKNSTYRELINTGVFVYVENRVVLNRPEFVVFINGKWELTKLATETPNSCMLSFWERLVSVSDYVPSDVMFHRDKEYIVGKMFPKTPGNMKLQEEAEHHIKDFENLYARKKTRLITTNQRMWEYIQDAGWNTVTFQNHTLLGPMEFSRVQKPDYVFKLPTYVAMAVGLGIALDEFQEIIRPSGIGFKDGDRTHEAYKYVIGTLRGRGIDYCNDFLESVGVKTLGAKERA